MYFLAIHSYKLIKLYRVFIKNMHIRINFYILHIVSMLLLEQKSDWFESLCFIVDF